MTAIADVYAQLLLDDKDAKRSLEQDLPASADKAGKTAGSRFGGAMGTAVKATLGGIAGGVAGAMFGMATKGAAELNSAVSVFAAETGATQAEIESAQGTISDLYKSNLQGFDQIGDAMAALRTQQGLTQESAEAMTQTYLDFANATGQDAAAAVSSFDDILDSWGLNAEDAAGLMDKLVVSHQQFGGTVEASQTTLAALAPAMKAANLEVDDGIALLNLFGAKGIDANTASAAFAKALTKVKSPEELQTLIADISATEDPFVRSQTAADLFGARAGAKLANALAGANLDDYKISLEEAAGASEAASAAIEGSFGNQATLLLKNFGGTLAEVGSNFGPLLLGFSSILPMATPIFTAAGSALGGILAAMIPIGMALLPVILIGAVVAAIAFLIANPEIAAKIGEFVGDLLEGLATFLGEVGTVLLDAFNTGVQMVGQAFGALVEIVGGILGQIGEIIGTAIGLWIEWVLLWPVKVWEAFLAILGFVGDLIAQAMPQIQAFVQGIIDFFLGIPGAIVGIVGQILGIFGQIAASVVEAVAGLIGRVVGFYLSLPGKIAGLVGQILGVFVRVASSVVGNVVGLVGKVVSTILGIPGKIGSLVGEFGKIAQQAVQAFMRWILDLPGKVAGVLGDIAGNIGGFLGGLIPKFEEGTDRVPYTGMAIVHEGEMIVPASAASQIRGGEAVLNYGEGLTQKQQAVSVTVNNPIPEPAGTSVAREMRKLAYMGVLS
jgi:phage-related minor tail protein